MGGWRLGGGVEEVETGEKWDLGVMATRGRRGGAIVDGRGHRQRGTTERFRRFDSGRAVQCAAGPRRPAGTSPTGTGSRRDVEDPRPTGDGSPGLLARDRRSGNPATGLRATVSATTGVSKRKRWAEGQKE